MADVGNTPEAQQRHYHLNARVSMDVPGSDEAFQRFMPFEVYHATVHEASWYRPDGQIIAAAGDEWIGMAAVGYFEHTQSMYNMITGVDRAYRGRGIAQALKLLSIRCARSYGARYIRTNNDSHNEPMLAINRKLGYQPEPGFYIVVRDLA
jgi:RimJ/RimL family protein N-acetyltransferase